MEKFSKIIVPAIIGLSAVGALYVCCTHTLSRRSRAAQIDMPSTPSLPEVRRARLIFAGDLMQHTPQLTAARTPEGDFDFNASFDWVRERFRAADAAIVNLETTLSESGPYTGYPCFRSPAALAEALDSLGVDITVLANNHCCDGGSKGIRTTIRELDRHGIEHTGVFLDSSDFRARHPLRFEAGGIRFALLNYTYGTNGLPVPSGLSVNPIDTVRIAADLAAVEHDGVDCVIACMHWGNEYERRPNKVQRQLAGFLRRHGVDLIVGSHPHVVQPYEQDSNGIVLYSLGNFVSNQRKRYCDGGIVATVEVTRFSRRFAALLARTDAGVGPDTRLPDHPFGGRRHPLHAGRFTAAVRAIHDGYPPPVGVVTVSILDFPFPFRWIMPYYRFSSAYLRYDLSNRKKPWIV